MVVYLEKIVLKNFRCFEKLEVTLDKMLTVVVGANGAGKTSLIRRNGSRYKYDVHSAGWSERPGD